MVKVGVVFGRVGGAERATATRRAPAMLGRVRVVLPIYIRYIGTGGGTCPPAQNLRVIKRGNEFCRANFIAEALTSSTSMMF